MLPKKWNHYFQHSSPNEITPAPKFPNENDTLAWPMKPEKKEIGHRAIFAHGRYEAICRSTFSGRSQKPHPVTTFFFSGGGVTSFILS